MDLARGSSPSSPASSPDSSADNAADRMELEAAEALAGLAYLATRVTATTEPATKWGSKGKRLRKRVKSESPPSDPALNPVDCGGGGSDLAQDQAVVDPYPGQIIEKNVLGKSVKVEQDADLVKPNPACSARCPSNGGGRSRQNLTEAEKEARRLRRILANRESARQTIRRRQALCEELTQKAADLERENENLKREKELALKEYQSLESTNKHLKAQMAKAIKVENVEIPGEIKSSAHLQIPALPTTNCSMFLYNQHPFPSFCWPSIIQSSNPGQLQHGPHNQSAIFVPPNVPLPPSCKLDTTQSQENPINTDGSKSPLYIVPYPWFFPFHPDHRNGLHPQVSCGMNNIHEETSMTNRFSDSSSSKPVVEGENNIPPLPIKVEKEAYGSIEARPNDPNGTSVRCPLDGVGQYVRLQSKEKIFVPNPLSSAGASFIVKQENVSDYVPNTENASTRASHSVSALPVENQETVNYASRKLLDAVAAAEARRRRKELTKIKNLHGRQCRMHC